MYYVDDIVVVYYCVIKDFGIVIMDFLIYCVMDLGLLVDVKMLIVNMGKVVGWIV